MACAYTGRVGELKDIWADGRLGEVLADNYQLKFGKPTDSLIRSWVNSIPVVLGAMNSSEFDDVLILVEAVMPIGDERADVVLLGGNENNRKAVVIELKQWSRIAPSDSPLLIDVPLEGSQQHPSAQALNYQGKLHMLQSVGATFSWHSYAVLHNLSDKSRDILENAETISLVAEAPVIYKEQIEELSENLKEAILPADLEYSVAQEFDNASYEQTRGFFEIIKNLAPEIARNVTEAIAESGTGLSQQQLILVENVLESVKQGEQRAFLVEGAPGSGKSLVAVHLLLRALEQEKQAILGLRNNRLIAILKACFDMAYRGASGATHYYSLPRNKRGGIADPQFNTSFDLVICDEAQRLAEDHIPGVMQRSPTIVLLFDETQILNPRERGTRENIERYAIEAGKVPTYDTLPAFMRCRGGRDYHEWVELLLQATGTGKPPQDLRSRWSINYEFDVFSDIEVMLDRLKDLRDEHRVALVASFTESPGNLRKSPGDIDNVRIGYPLKSGFDIYEGLDLEISWLMDPRKDYRPFWLEGGSNNLDRASSIYGCQGFEGDYVGVIWGRDFIWRNGLWELGQEDCIYDNIDSRFQSSLKQCFRNDPALALTLLKNRYRIFLTRGMLGTFIFCEDEPTGEYLASLL